MDPTSALLFGVLIPAVAAGIVLFLAARSARGEPARAQPFAGALALGSGFLAAQAGLAGVPPTPWSGDTVPYLGLVFWMVAGAIAIAPLRTAPGLGRDGNAFYVALFAILPYHLIRDESVPRPVLDLKGFGAVLLVYALWIALERLARRRPGPTVPVALWAACAGTAVVLLANRSGSQAQLVGALAAGLGAAAVVALVVRGAHLASGAIAILAIVVASLVRVAQLYDLPDASWILVAVAFAGPWVGEIPALRARSPLLAGALAFAAALAPAAVAAWIAFDARAPSPYG